ncbi:cytochrome P450 [Coprinopsis marcescibilis]|uniref:Cytochrome P450 n=1 Tax=Coprinopsis marcescibilis TaxID=230819 RepID=A0A5C3LED5_COPMA|nr:cytochrome P450 [Coprinopsis marcescibilis]
MVTSFSYYALAGLAGWVSYEWYRFTSVRNKLLAIPTIGSDSFFLAYISAWKFVFSGRKMIQEGYDKYPNGIYKVPCLEVSSRWMIIVSSLKLVQDIKDAPGDVLSAHEHFADILQADQMFGPEARAKEDYHVPVLMNSVTRNLAGCFGDIVDEVAQSFADGIPQTDEWVLHPIQARLSPIVSRTANRLFVGKTLCRDKEFLDLQQNWALSFMLSVTAINLAPDFLKGAIGKAVSAFPKTIKKLRQIMDPEFSYRIQMEEEHGKRWDGRPNDLISWLLDHAPPEYRTADDMAYRILIVNFAAIHTTMMTVSGAIVDLATHPEHIGPLRLEVESVIKTHGWTKEAMAKMWKLDSFLKESARLGGVAALSMNRKVLKEFTFSNGITVPPGVTVGCATHSIQGDPAVYENAATFDGFRFSNMRETETAEFGQVKHQFSTLSNDFLLFGGGRHACPGRFFAVNESKCIFAHILLNYDIKVSSDHPIPPPTWLGSQRLFPSEAKVLFRKRQV